MSWRLPITIILCGTFFALPNPTLAQGPQPQVKTAQEPVGKSAALGVGLSAGAATLGVGLLLLSGNDAVERIDPLEPVLLSAGLTLYLFGPSVGHLYTGNHWRAALFSGGRVVFGALTLYGVMQAIDHQDTEDPHGTRNDALLLTGLVGGLGLTVWETIDVYYCAKRTQRSGVELALSPLLLPSRSGSSRSMAPGLALSGRF